MGTDAHRGEVWLLDLGEPVGHDQGWHSPALIVSSDEWNRHENVVTVLPITRTEHELPTSVKTEPGPRTGLSERSYARCEDIRSVSDRRLMRRMGVVDIVTMSLLGRVLRTLLEI